MKNAVKIKGTQLEKLINESTKRHLNEFFCEHEMEPQGQSFYICTETVYDNGTTNTWIGTEEDAQECEQSSEGSAYGPFSSYEEAENYAAENGITIGEEDYANKFGDAVSDTFGLNENRIRQIVRETLSEITKKRK